MAAKYEMNKMVQVEIRLVNGGLITDTKPIEFIQKMNSLKRSGYQGRQLINELWDTDDWGPPPSFMNIRWSDDDNRQREETIRYN